MSRSSRFYSADCPTCGDQCKASDRSADAHRMWARRHADRTGHNAHVTTEVVRVYRPRAQPDADEGGRDEPL